MSEYLQYLDGFAGLAALINGLLLWPIVRMNKKNTERQDGRLDDHETRIGHLERQ
jgi:hypothetical protein